MVKIRPLSHSLLMRVSTLLRVNVVEVSFTTESAVNVLRKSGASMNTRTCTWVVFQAKYPVKSTVRRNLEMQVHLTYARPIKGMPKDTES